MENKSKAAETSAAAALGNGSHAREAEPTRRASKYHLRPVVEQEKGVNARKEALEGRYGKAEKGVIGWVDSGRDG
ncbi:hypothetical protein V500_11457 [Pseudogymnoascus sp. VKM F-4518 (FW-2643)]|nr:hypothetical protein V500_11457 [Pseudogymnoascus sp. VKM F-4518 (FW-2643)]